MVTKNRTDPPLASSVIPQTTVGRNGTSANNDEAEDCAPSPRSPAVFIGITFLLALFFISRHNYLLFHGLVELFSIAVAWAVFMLAWNSRRFVGNDALVFLGTTYFFIGLIDLLHTLAYKEMGVFPGQMDANLATQLGIAARYMEGFSLLAFAILIGKNIRSAYTILLYTVATLLLLPAVFLWPVFPDCCTEDVVQTPFKEGSEYVICFLLIVSLAVLNRKRSLIPPPVFVPMVTAILLTIVGELAFVFHIRIYGISCFIGHFAKLLSFYWVYVALIRSGLTHSCEFPFRKWRQAEHRYRTLFENAPVGIFTTTSTGRVLDVNPEMARIFGYPSSREVRERISDLSRQFYAVPERRAEFFDELTTVGRVQGFEYEVVSATGKHFWLRLNARVGETLADGSFTIDGFVVDITSTKRAQDELSRERALLKTVFMSTVGCFVLKDRSGVYRSVNPAFCRFLGKNEAEIIGKTDCDLFPAEDASQFVEGDKRVMETGVVEDTDWPVMAEKARRWLRMIKTPVRGPSDEITGVLCSLSDITTRKRVECLLRTRLRLSEYADSHSLEEVLQRVVDNAERLTDSKIGFLHFIKTDQQTIELKIWSTHTMGTACRVTISDGHYPAEKAGAWTDCILQGRPVIHNDYASLPHRRGLPPGHATVVRELVIPVFHDGVVVAILGVGNKAFDYTSEDVEVAEELVKMAWEVVVRKQAEKELVESRRSLQAILGNLPGIVYRCRYDSSYTMHYISDGCRTLAGYDPENLVGNRDISFNEIIHPDDRQCVWNAIRAALKAGTRFEMEYRIVHRDGRERWVWERGQQTSGENDTRPIIEGFISDITDRRETEEKMRMQALVLDQIHDRVAITDLSGTITYANEAVRKELGTQFNKLIGQETEAFWGNVDCGAPQQEILEKTLAEGRWRGEVETFSKKGGTHILVLRTQLVKDSRGKAIALCGIATDITEMRKQEATQRRLASAIDHAAESIIITDPDGTIVFVNPSFENITGYNREEVIGKNPRLLKSGKQNNDFYRDLWENITSGRTWTGQFINLKKNGSPYVERGTISPVLNDAGTIINFVAVKNDVTDELKLEERLVQAQKMEAIGTLAGGIAHDFNNILFPIVGFTEMMKEDLPADSPLQEYASDILSAALRARDLVQQILAFSRQSNQERKAIRVQNILKEAIKLARASLPSSITVKHHFSTSCPPILADPTQIHQIAMNLITNAYHAMEGGGGMLTLVLETDTLCGNAANDTMLPPGNYVCLKVSDTGSGINSTIQGRIFEPYFTTKEEGKGTGLGLSVIHGIVTSYHGDIKVQSEPGRGTTFTVYLPCIEATPEKPSAKNTAPIQGGHERILVVDDETLIVNMIGKMLERLGYRVTTRTASIEALELFRADPNRFDLVISDMTMPHMTGDRLTKEIKRIRPDIPVILCTGFSSQIDEQRAEELGVQGFVFKPILQRDISTATRKALEKQGSQIL